jgi:hypothetical protein
LQEYHCQLAALSLPSTSIPMIDNSLGIPYPLSYDKLSSNHKHFSLNVSSHVEPKYYHQAIKDPLWRDAMQVEISALERLECLLIYLLTNMPLVANGCLKSNTRLMGLSKGIKHV